MGGFDSIWLGAAVFLLAFINIAINFYVAYVKIQEFESHFKKSEWVIKNKILRGGSGFYTRMHRLCMLRVILRSPKLCHRRGGLDLEEFNSLPNSLMRWIRYPAFLTNINLIMGAAYWLWLNNKFPFNF